MNIIFINGSPRTDGSTARIMNDDLEKLSRTLALADGVIIGSPTYASNVSGQLKTFIDRGHLIMEQGLHKKYAIGIITGENYGASAAASILRKVLAFSGAFVTGMSMHKLPFTKSPQLDKRITKNMEAKAERLYWDIKEKRQYFIQSMIHRLIFNAGIKPFVMKKGRKYEGVINRWKNF